MCITRNDFEIQFTTGYGQPFLLDALTFLPANNSELTHGVGVVMDEEGQSSTVWHESPFISLSLMTGPMLNKVQFWLNDILFSNLDDWPEFSYRHRDFRCQRDILQAICRFFTRQASDLDNESIDRQEWPGRPRMLRKALEMSILTFVMGHQILIPEDEKLRLALELDIYIPQGNNVSCRLVNKIFKMMLLPKLKQFTEDVLTELHASFRDSKNPWDWGFDLSVMVLLLTVIAENQISLDDAVACAIRRGDLSRSREVDAIADIKSLETNLSNVLIRLFEGKYKSRGMLYNPFKSRRQGEEMVVDEATQNLVRDISRAIDAHGKSIHRVLHAKYADSFQETWLFPWPEIEDMLPDQLGSLNVARLLSKFLKPFFEPAEDHHRSMVVGRRHEP